MGAQESSLTRVGVDQRTTSESANRHPGGQASSPAKITLKSRSFDKKANDKGQKGNEGGFSPFKIWTKSPSPQNATKKAAPSSLGDDGPIASMPSPPVTADLVEQAKPASQTSSLRTSGLPLAVSLAVSGSGGEQSLSLPDKSGTTTMEPDKKEEHNQSDRKSFAVNGPSLSLDPIDGESPTTRRATGANESAASQAHPQPSSPSTNSVQQRDHESQPFVTGGNPGALKARSPQSSCDKRTDEAELSQDDINFIFGSMVEAFDHSITTLKKHHPSLDERKAFLETFEASFHLPTDALEPMWKAILESPSKNVAVRKRLLPRTSLKGESGSKMVSLMGEEYAEAVKKMVPENAQINPKVLDRLGTAEVLSSKLRNMFGADISAAKLMIVDEELMKERRQATMHASSSSGVASVSMQTSETVERIVTTQKEEVSSGTPGAASPPSTAASVEPVSPNTLNTPAPPSPREKRKSELQRFSIKLQSLFGAQVSADQLAAATQEAIRDQLEGLMGPTKTSETAIKPPDITGRSLSTTSIPSRGRNGSLNHSAAELAKYMKAIDMLGDDSLLDMVRKAVPDTHTQNTTKITAILGEAVVNEKTRKVMGDAMTGEQLAALKKAEEQQKKAEQDELIRILHSKEARESQQQLSAIPTMKALTILGDEKLEDQARSMLPASAKITTKTMQIMGTDIVSVKKDFTSSHSIRTVVTSSTTVAHSIDRSRRGKRKSSSFSLGKPTIKAVHQATSDGSSPAGADAILNALRSKAGSFSSSSKVKNDDE